MRPLRTHKHLCMCMYIHIREDRDILVYKIKYLYQVRSFASLNDLEETKWVTSGGLVPRCLQISCRVN